MVLTYIMWKINLHYSIVSGKNIKKLQIENSNHEAKAKQLVKFV